MRAITAEGTLIGIPLPERGQYLDGFWQHGRRPASRLLVFVHGMGGSFHGSRFKKELVRQGPAHGYDTLFFNNRGHTSRVADERFEQCLQDLDLVLAFARRQGYRRFVLMGHSTGCQKIAYYQARRRRRDVRALVLAAPADDAALARRDLGRAYGGWIRRARLLVARGRGVRRLPARCHGYSARRFLSCSDLACVEARLFDYGGPMRHYGRVREPVLAFFGEAEEFACLPVARMGEILRRRSASRAFHYFTVPRATHCFSGVEPATVRRVYRWLERAVA